MNESDGKWVKSPGMMTATRSDHRGQVVYNRKDGSHYCLAGPPRMFQVSWAPLWYCYERLLILLRINTPVSSLSYFEENVVAEPSDKAQAQRNKGLIMRKKSGKLKTTCRLPVETKQRNIWTYNWRQAGKSLPVIYAKRQLSDNMWEGKRLLFILKDNFFKIFDWYKHNITQSRMLVAPVKSRFAEKMFSSFQVYFLLCSLLWPRPRVRAQPIDFTLCLHHRTKELYKHWI